MALVEKTTHTGLLVEGRVKECEAKQFFHLSQLEQGCSEPTSLRHVPSLLDTRVHRETRETVDDFSHLLIERANET